MKKTPIKEHPAFKALEGMVNPDWKLRLKQSRKIFIQPQWSSSGVTTFSLRIDGFNFRVYLAGVNQPFNDFEQF